MNTEDAASVLDQFVHDVANLPAEIAHLLEEIHAKDELIQECRSIINNRDAQLQKHIKQVGGHIKHPKEEQFMKLVVSSYDKARALQDDKVSLSQKACFLLDRQVKRLDLKIRDLVNEGALASDPTLPSLLHDSAANLVPPASTSSTGVNTPLPALPFTAGSTTIANAAMARLAANGTLNRAIPQAPMAGMPSFPQSREVSAGPDSKRRRLNASLGTLPTPTSNLARHSPGIATPKAGTPGATAIRAGSVGPRTKKSGMKKIAPHQQTNMLRKKVTKLGASKRAGGARSTRTSASPSMTADSGSGDEGNTSINMSLGPGGHHDGAADEEEPIDELGYDEDDKNVYCTCRSLSHGNMVACDNERCAYEWFHWECVGLTKEPVGRWICPECKKLPSSQVKLAK